MNKKSMNEIAHTTRLIIEKHNVSNLTSDEDNVLVSKLIVVELHPSIMSTSEWWLNKETKEQINEGTKKRRNNRTIGHNFKHHQSIYQNHQNHQNHQLIRTIRNEREKNNPFCDKNLLMLFNVYKSTVNSEICIHPDEMQSNKQLKIDYMLG
jgi:hypothetical protein